jgi:hypothetical protein
MVNAVGVKQVHLEGEQCRGSGGCDAIPCSDSVTICRGFKEPWWRSSRARHVRFTCEAAAGWGQARVIEGRHPSIKSAIAGDLNLARVTNFRLSTACKSKLELARVAC